MREIGARNERASPTGRRRHMKRMILPEILITQSGPQEEIQMDAEQVKC